MRHQEERESSWLHATENYSSYLNRREFTLHKGSQEFTASTRRNRLKIGKKQGPGADQEAGITADTVVVQLTPLSFLFLFAESQFWSSGLFTSHTSDLTPGLIGLRQL